MILITGAAGKTGQAIIKALVKEGYAVRGFVRSEEQARLVKKLGTQEEITGDLLDKQAIYDAHINIHATYHICPNVHPDEIRIGQNVIEAARRVGVKRFVFHSVLHPHVEAMPHHWRKMRVEEMIFESGLPFTILQPAAYMQNILTGWDSITQRGLYEVPYSMEARISIVDLNDIAEVAVKVLTESSHSGAIYELAGPQPLSQIEVADILSKKLGCAVTPKLIEIGVWQTNAERAGLVPYQVETLKKMFQYYDKFGFQGNPKVLQKLLGRSPTTFEAFIDRIITKQGE